MNKGVPLPDSGPRDGKRQRLSRSPSQHPAPTSVGSIPSAAKPKARACRNLSTTLTQRCSGFSESSLQSPPAGPGTLPPSAVLPVFEAESQQPCNFSLDVQDRVCGGEFLLQPLHLRLQPLHLRRQRVGLGAACGPASSDSDRIARPLDAPCASWPDGSCTDPLAEAADPPRRGGCIGPLPPESAAGTPP